MMDTQIRELQQRLHTAHTNFVRVAEALAPTLRNQAGVCGDWSPKEVVAHLTGWDGSLKQLIVDIENFNPPYDVDKFNACSVQARAEVAWDGVMAELTTNFVALTQALTIVEPKMKIYARVRSWLAGRIADYELHTAQFDPWMTQ
ncbi:MAG: hypothetical protein R3C14_55185 [Caldilineaceae bacterium]